MEHMSIFHRIFHEDLHPLTNQKNRDYYIDYFETSNGYSLNHQEIKDPETIYLNDHTLKYLYYKGILDDALKEIKSELHKKLFSFYEQDTAIKSMVQNYQMFILNYMKTIHQDYLPEESCCQIFHIAKKKSDIDIFKLLYITLDSLLIYIEQSFTNFIDKSLTIPYQQRLWFINQNKEKAKEIHEKIQKSQIPEIIKNEIGSILTKIESNTLTDLTYDSQEYYKTLLKVVWHVLKENSAIPLKERLSVILISLEFNTFKIFFFLTQEIKDIIKTCNTNEEKLDKYREHLKKIKTTAVTTSYQLNPQLPSLKKNLLSWIVEEIDFCEQQIVSKRSLQRNQEEKKLLKISVPEVSLISE